MKIGCVYSVDDFSHKLPTFASIPFGISFISTALKQAGHEPRILVVTPQTNISRLIGGYMKKHEPKLMCLTAVSSQYPTICSIAEKIKEIDPDTRVILGGHHATLNPEAVIVMPCFDAICIGEGERAVVEFAAGIEKNEIPTGINNLWIKTDEGRSIEKNPQDPFIQDLDRLPPIDREIWDEWIEDKNRYASVLLGRGCPNRCTYCSNHALARISKGKYVRFRSAESVISELECLLGRYPSLNTVFLEMETIAVKTDYAFEICDRLARFNAARENPVAFGTNLAVSKKVVDNEELFKRLKLANFAFINVGLESGAERVRNEILRRPRYSNREFLEFCRLAKKHEIDVNIFVLMGIPGETEEDFRETVECVRASDPQHVFLCIFYPYPGTDLYLKAKETGVLTEALLDPTMERQRALMDLPGFPRKRIQREYLLFPYKVYKGKKSLVNILAIMLRMYVGAHPFLNSLYRRVTDTKYMSALKKRFSSFKE